MSKFEQRRQQVLTPALEGSKPIRPNNSFGYYRPFSQADRDQFRDRPFTQEGGGSFGPRGRPFTPGVRNMGSFPRGFHPGVLHPSFGYPYGIPGERVSVPTILQRPRYHYMGPPSLMPQWGGYSVGPHYYPGFFYIMFSFYLII